MFGYVRPDNPYLYIKDDTLYKSLYCSVCKSIGKLCGQSARIGLTFDIAFMSAFVHNVTGVDVIIEKKRCLAHWIMPRPIAKRDEISDVCAYINTSLAYYKLEDDISDGNGGRIKKLLFSRGNRRAKKAYLKISEIIVKRYDELRSLEKKNCSVLDEACEPFSEMMVELGDLACLGKEVSGAKDLFYFLGKWIYLIDALDDYDKDIKEKNYNPFYYAYDKKPDFAALIKDCGKDISFVFGSVFSGLRQGLENCEFKFNADLINNVILRGIPQTTLKIFNKNTTKKEKRKKNG